MHWSLALLAGVSLAITDADPWIVALTATFSTTLALASAAHIAAAVAPTTRDRVNFALLLCAPIMLIVGFWRADSAMPPDAGLATTDLAGQAVRLTGVVIDEPQRRNVDLRFLLVATQIELGAERYAVDARVQIHAPSEAQVAYGDRIAVDVSLTPTAASETEYLQWLDQRGVAATGRVQARSIEVLATDQLSAWRTLAHDARIALNQSLRDALPPPLSGIAQGMITGRRDAIDPQLRQQLNDTSLSHLIVISGSNLTLLTTIVMAVSAWLIGRRPAALLAILAALSYGALIGPDPPVQRAMWMAIVFALTHLLGRGASALNAIGFSAALMTMLEPHILLDLSFQLTLAGTLGIVLLTPSRANTFLSGEDGPVGAARDAALLTVVAALATMPLIVLHFERAALIGVFANIIVTPLFAWMFLGSAASAVLGLISAPLAEGLSWALAWLPLRWLELVATNAATWPGGGEPIAGFRHVHLITIYAALLLVAWKPHRERVRRWRRQATQATQATNASLARFTPLMRRIGLEPAAGRSLHLRQGLAVGAVCAVGATLWFSACSEPEDTLRIHFLNVGHGDAALIITPNDHTILIDTGAQADAALAALRRHLPTETRRLDLIVITHPQSDHASALWAILDRYDASQALLSPYADQTQLGQQVMDLLAQHDVHTLTAQPGRQLVFSGDTDLILDMLWPPTSGLSARELDDPNATSIVLRARFGDARLLFTGDINVEQELNLSRAPCPGSNDPCDLRADVLKVAHQGSRYSTSTLFLDAVNPTLAIISAASDNPFGHPDQEVLVVLEQIGATPLLTATHGDITVITDGQSIQTITQQSARNAASSISSD